MSTPPAPSGFLVVPAVDVLGGAVVRLRQGDFAQVTAYAADPIAAVRGWTDAGARLVHVVDLEGARHGQPDRMLWAALGSSGAVVQLGGGIRTVEAATSAMAAGIARVVVGTAAVWNPSVLAQMVEQLGTDRVVVAIDVRDGLASGSGWEGDGRPVVEVVGDVAAAGIRHAFVTGIARDGTMAGPDLELMAEVASAAPDVSVLASGGVGSLDDLVDIAKAGFAGAIIGRALYEGRFTLAEALAAVG